MARDSGRDWGRRALWAWVPSASVAIAIAVASAQAPEQAPAAPKVAEPADYGLSTLTDPLDRARAVAKLGDARVLSLLAVKHGEHGAVLDAERVLAAIASVRWLADPGPAMPALVELMQGRDPDLAPAAARALVEVARLFVEAERTPESVSPDTLAAWATKLAPLEQNPRIRPDLRLAATEAIALFNAARERL